MRCPSEGAGKELQLLWLPEDPLQVRDPETGVNTNAMAQKPWQLDMVTNPPGLSPDELLGQPVGQSGIYMYQTGRARRRNNSISSMAKNNTENPVVRLTLKKVSRKAENSPCSHPTGWDLQIFQKAKGEAMAEWGRRSFGDLAPWGKDLYREKVRTQLLEELEQEIKSVWCIILLPKEGNSHTALSEHCLLLSSGLDELLLL